MKNLIPASPSGVAMQFFATAWEGVLAGGVLNELPFEAERDRRPMLMYALPGTTDRGGTIGECLWTAPRAQVV